MVSYKSVFKSVNVHSRNLVERLTSVVIKADDQTPLPFFWHRMLARLMLSGENMMYDLQGFLFYQLAQQVACRFSVSIGLSRLYYVGFPLYQSE